MTNSWMNEDGEPIMSGEAWRFEQQLDIDSEHDRYLDDYARDDEPTCLDVNDDDVDERGRRWCYGCDEYADHTKDILDEPDPIEDQWLDGSWEE